MKLESRTIFRLSLLDSTVAKECKQLHVSHIALEAGRV